MELLGELHQTQRLSIALGMRHAEVALQLLLRVAAALVSDDHYRVVVQTRPTADDRGVVAKCAIAVELDEIGEGEPDVIRGEWALGVARDLHPLEWGEILVDFLAQVVELALERLDRLCHAELTVACRLLDLVDLPLQLGDRFFKLELCC